ncbi:hypothetical protein [Alkaliphilus hydrothermalis]|uniref:Uncharacterized protein n=1 Tax=Alkaliphilus hydrothermalis TaxID=1482730 RepID=A0ABS2NPR4_9FIRM|nr:hypothetical protein [Alkaliphilus hydrothermalis]MBM7614807.1 hypothetical protein [Alkaliphilus hydrothermalis]
MATYKQIQTYVKETYGFVPKSCWIAHMKEIKGIESRKAYNRMDDSIRKYPCPEDKQQYIESAFRYFKIIG